jgi:putative membrane protein
MMPGFGYGCTGFGAFGWWGFILNAVFGILLLVGLVWLTVWAVRRFSSRNPAGSNGYSVPSTASARDLAQMRYARGEITREQYQQLLEDLSR